jgi:tetratricopeptide (TPR) repeat protein
MDKNIVSGSITAGGNVHIGDSFVHLKEAKEFQVLEARKCSLEEDIQTQRETISAIQDNNSTKKKATTVLLKMEIELSEVDKQLKELKKIVIELAERLQYVTIDNPKLYRIRQFFEAGQFDLAFEELKNSDIESQASALLDEKRRIEKSQQDNDTLCSEAANNLYITAKFAGLKVSDFERVVQVEKYFNQSLELKRDIKVLSEFCNFLCHNLLWDKAAKRLEELHAEVAKLVETYSEPIDRENLGNIMNVLGVCQVHMNQFTDAKFSFEVAIGLYHRLRAEGCNVESGLATTLSNWGAELSNYKQGAEHLKEALSIRRTLAESDEQYLPDVAQTLNNLGTFYCKHAEWQLSVDSLNEAIAITMRLISSNRKESRNLAGALMNLGVALEKLNKIEESESAFLEALAIAEGYAEININNSLQGVADISSNLGALYFSKSEYDKAEKFLNRSAESYAQLTAAQPSSFRKDIGHVCTNLSQLYVKTGRIDLAEENGKKALSIYEELIKTNGPSSYRDNVAKNLLNLGYVAIEKNEFEAAQRYYDRALDIRISLASENPKGFSAPLISAVSAIGAAYQKSDRNREAYEIYKSYLPTHAAIEYQDEATYAEFANNFALSCVNEKDYEVAGEYYSKGINVRRRLFEKSSEVFRYNLAHELDNLGLFYKLLEKNEHAAQTFEEVCRLRNKFILADHYRSQAESLSNLGLSYAALNKWDDSEAAFRRSISLHIFVNVNFGGNDQEILNQQHNLDVLYREKNKAVNE